MGEFLAGGDQHSTLGSKQAQSGQGIVSQLLAPGSTLTGAVDNRSLRIDEPPSDADEITQCMTAMRGQIVDSLTGMVELSAQFAGRTPEITFQGGRVVIARPAAEDKAATIAGIRSLDTVAELVVP